MGTSTYLIGIGGNQRTKHGGPRAVIAHALRGFVSSCEKNSGKQSHKVTKKEERLIAHSRIVESQPLGPGLRRYGNAVALIESNHSPLKLLKALKRIERAYGRRPGRRWGDRPLDLDIIGWSGGIWVSPGLTIPHPAFRARRFVLEPLVEVASGWRDPVTRLTARQLLTQINKKKPRNH